MVIEELNARIGVILSCCIASYDNCAMQHEIARAFANRNPVEFAAASQSHTGATYLGRKTNLNETKHF
jgi:hypothetical protein